MRFRPEYQQLLLLFGIIVALFFLWTTPVVLPLKILVVFFHEASHALMTILTGGTVHEMVVSYDQGGHVVSSGGIRFLILSAGYLGSLMWGVFCYLIAVKTEYDRSAMMLLGLALLIITALFMRNIIGIAFGAITGVAFLVIGLKARNSINDIILQVIGITSMLYAPLDIYSDVIMRAHLRSDARMLAEEFFLPTQLWGFIWIGISTIILYLTIMYSIKHLKPARKDA